MCSKWIASRHHIIESFGFYLLKKKKKNTSKIADKFNRTEIVGIFLSSLESQWVFNLPKNMLKKFENYEKLKKSFISELGRFTGYVSSQTANFIGWPLILLWIFFTFAGNKARVPQNKYVLIDSIRCWNRTNNLSHM